MRKSSGNGQAILESTDKLSEVGRELEQSGILAAKGEMRLYIFMKFLHAL